MNVFHGRFYQLIEYEFAVLCMKNFLRGQHVSVFKYSATTFNGGENRGKETTWKIQVKDGRIIL
jgi:hypothetical protein